jgi:hypothetical protein
MKRSVVKQEVHTGTAVLKSVKLTDTYLFLRKAPQTFRSDVLNRHNTSIYQLLQI